MSSKNKGADQLRGYSRGDLCIGIVFVQDSCAVYGKNLESLEKKRRKEMLCIGSELCKCLLICADWQTGLF